MDWLLNWEGWRWVTFGACGVGLAGALIFVVMYQVKVGWAWWHNPYGRYLMGRKALLAALFILIFANRLAPAWDGRIMVTAILMSLFAIQTFVPYRLLLKVQDRTGHNPEKVEAP